MIVLCGLRIPQVLPPDEALLDQRGVQYDEVFISRSDHGARERLVADRPSGMLHMLVNGTVSPELHVQPRKYRLRILNACQARFLNLQLYQVANGDSAVPFNPKTLAPTAPGGPPFLQIGTEGGMLSSPVLVRSAYDM